jgi:hypothetical protein
MHALLLRAAYCLGVTHGGGEWCNMSLWELTAIIVNLGKATPERDKDTACDCELAETNPHTCILFLYLLFYYYAPLQNFEKRLLAASCLSVCLPFHMDGTTRLKLKGF